MLELGAAPSPAADTLLTPGLWTETRASTRPGFSQALRLNSTADPGLRLADGRSWDFPASLRASASSAERRSLSSPFRAVGPGALVKSPAPAPRPGGRSPSSLIPLEFHSKHFGKLRFEERCDRSSPQSQGHWIHQCSRKQREPILAERRRETGG